MLDFFGEREWGEIIIRAIEGMFEEGVGLTPDMGGTASTEQVGTDVIRQIENFVKIQKKC